MTEPTRSPYVYNATIVNIVDGDTVDLQVDLGFKIQFTERYRLFGIDAWEVRGPERPEGLAAKEWISQFVDKQVLIQTVKDRKGKYGRYLATIWHEGRNLNEELVRLGHAENVDY